MTAYACRVALTPHTELALRHLDALGLVAADHQLVVGGEIQLTLTDREIGEIELAGVPVVRGEPLLVRADRSDGPPAGVDLTTGFVTGYLDAVQVAAATAALAAAHPTRCTLTTLPLLTSGYDGSLASAVGPAPIQLLRITTDPTTRSRPGFLLICGTHAREWMNPLVALEFAGQLLNNVDPASADPEVVAITRIVTEGDILIIPALNPDGLNYTVHDDAGWRKNRRPNPGAPGCPGVDNNRNYEVYFGGAGSSADPCSDAYCGPGAVSEAENAGVRWVLEQFPNVLVGVDAHSYGQQILRPGPGGGSFIATLPVSAADHAIYTGLENVLGNAITAVNGAVYSTGSTSNHAGTSDEQMFFAHRVFGFNTECGTSFQPPWASAVPVIEEVVAGLKALALATVDVVATTPTPLSVVQCIDRTGSMVAFGYDATARSNAKRFVDLLSLGDSTGLVSFADPSPDPLATPAADRAQIEAPLTLLDDPGDAANLRAAVDGIAFGGWTPIGAGLQLSASMLAGAPAPTSVLLLSDGYENRNPTVASVLPLLPAGLRVFTVALGPAADAPLLQQIAIDTGGEFLLSPTALELHQVYNDMRAGLTDDGLLLNAVVPPSAEADQWFDVEPNAERLTVTVSALSANLKRAVFALVAPSGRTVRPDDFGARTAAGSDYAVLSLDRPAPGRWRVRLSKRRTTCVVGAVLASPVRVRLEVPARAKRGEAVELRAEGRFDKRRLGALRVEVSSQVLGIAPLDKGLDPDRSDPDRLAKLRAPWGQPLVWREGRATALPVGFSQLRIHLEGVLPGGATFRRVATRVVQVLA